MKTRIVIIMMVMIMAAPINSAFAVHFDQSLVDEMINYSMYMDIISLEKRNGIKELVVIGGFDFKLESVKIWMLHAPEGYNYSYFQDIDAQIYNEKFFMLNFLDCKDFDEEKHSNNKGVVFVNDLPVFVMKVPTCEKLPIVPRIGHM